MAIQKERVFIGLQDDLLEYLKKELGQLLAVTGHPKAKLLLEMVRWEIQKRGDE